MAGCKKLTLTKYDMSAKNGELVILCCAAQTNASLTSAHVLIGASGISY